VSSSSWKEKVFLSFLPETDAALDFIGASLETLRVECPAAYESICQQMAGRSLLLIIDQEHLRLDFLAHQVRVQPAREGEDSPPPTRLQTSAQTILDLADARLTLVEAVLYGRLDLYGYVSDLGVLYDSILTYARGVIRCRSAPALLDHYRSVHTPAIS
jgi:hypothetical protein